MASSLARRTSRNFTKKHCKHYSFRILAVLLLLFGTYPVFIQNRDGILSESAIVGKIGLASTICECDRPGSFAHGENGYHCSDPLYDGHCGWRKACLVPLGHVWNLHTSSILTGLAPCGGRQAAKMLRKHGAYSKVSEHAACSRTMIGVSLRNSRLCAEYDRLETNMPNCTGRATVVPRILHSVGRDKHNFLVSSTVTSNPTFRQNRHDDKSAAEYILAKCGQEAASAYSCLTPSAFRADLFRFCALYSEGGVYLDEDIFPLHHLEDIVSVCSSATIGHDFPTGGKPAKQMKLLASSPGAAIFQCALLGIINNVRKRIYPSSPLELTGPLLLERCYADHNNDVAITYKDTRQAVWPYTGLRAGSTIIAYEYPSSSKHFCAGKECIPDDDYAKIFRAKRVYSAGCTLF